MNTLNPAPPSPETIGHVASALRMFLLRDETGLQGVVQNASQKDPFGFLVGLCAIWETTIDLSGLDGLEVLDGWQRYATVMSKAHADINNLTPEDFNAEEQ